MLKTERKEENEIGHLKCAIVHGEETGHKHLSDAAEYTVAVRIHLIRFHKQDLEYIGKADADVLQPE